MITLDDGTKMTVEQYTNKIIRDSRPLSNLAAGIITLDDGTKMTVEQYTQKIIRDSRPLT